jgi:hypothetical protein
MNFAFPVHHFSTKFRKTKSSSLPPDRLCFCFRSPGQKTVMDPSQSLKKHKRRLPKLAISAFGLTCIILAFGQQWSFLSEFSNHDMTNMGDAPMSELLKTCSDDNKTKIPKFEEGNRAKVYSRFIRDFAQGVDPVYLEMLELAERKSAEDFATSHTRGDRGVAIGPTDGRFDYTFKAMQNAKRIRYILGNDRSVKIALLTSNEHLSILAKECSDTPTSEFAEACRLWANNTLFDDVIVPKDYEFRGNDNHTTLDQGRSNHQLKALGGYRLAPYTRTMFVDSDAYPCPGFDKLFDLVTPVEEWQIPSEAPADLAIGIDQWAGEASRFWNPGDDHVYEDFRYFRQRNTGVVLFHFHSLMAHTFAHLFRWSPNMFTITLRLQKPKRQMTRLPFEMLCFFSNGWSRNSTNNNFRCIRPAVPTQDRDTSGRMDSETECCLYNKTENIAVNVAALLVG